MYTLRAILPEKKYWPNDYLDISDNTESYYCNVVLRMETKYIIETIDFKCRISPNKSITHMLFSTMASQRPCICQHSSPCKTIMFCECMKCNTIEELTVHTNKLKRETLNVSTLIIKSAKQLALDFIINTYLNIDTFLNESAHSQNLCGLYEWFKWILDEEYNLKEVDAKPILNGKYGSIYDIVAHIDVALNELTSLIDS